MPLRFQDEFLKKLEYLQVVSRREFAGRNRADRRTPKKGRGIEFADHRQYARGDDFRHIDWKAYKRVNRLLLRLFEEEQDLPIYLILDVSGSMAEEAKFDLGIIRRHETPALGRNEGAADAAALLRADRNVLQIGLDRGKPSRGGRAERYSVRMIAASP